MNDASAVKRLWSQPDMLGIEWADGASDEFASLWLRDNLREDRDPHSGQRLIDIADLPEDPKIRSAAARDGAVIVEWEAESKSGSFELAWLRTHASKHSASRAQFAPKHWLQAARLDAARDFAWAAFPSIRSDRSLRGRWLTRLVQDGIAFLSGVPSIDAGILEAAALVGRVSETNYGRMALSLAVAV